MAGSTPLIDKTLLRHRFGAAAESYDDTAVVQAEVADRLVALLPPTVAPERVLEIGCGTGLLSYRLTQRLSGATFVFNDIAPEVERILRLKVGIRHTFITADAEHSAWDGTYGLIASSSCIQWWHDPLSFFPKSHRALLPHGHLLYSTFLPDTFCELRRTTGAGLLYPTADQILETIHGLHFAEHRHEIYSSTLHFRTFTELLRHIKQTGTNAMPAHTVWTPRMIAHLDHTFREANDLPLGAPYPLTYNTIIGIATK